MEQTIASAFSHRQRPANVTNIVVCSSLRDDALHFTGKSRESLTAEDWINYSDAFYGLTPDAFVYFLPSVLTLSLNIEGGLMAGDALVMALDTSAEPDIWPEWFSERFGLLTSAELAVLKDWAARYLAGTERGEGSEFARVQDTVTALALALET